jgi:hypothetical protein
LAAFASALVFLCVPGSAGAVEVLIEPKPSTELVTVAPQDKAAFTSTSQYDSLKSQASQSLDQSVPNDFNPLAEQDNVDETTAHDDLKKCLVNGLDSVANAAASAEAENREISGDELRTDFVTGAKSCLGGFFVADAIEGAVKYLQELVGGVIGPVTQPAALVSPLPSVHRTASSGSGGSFPWWAIPLVIIVLGGLFAGGRRKRAQ